MASKFFRQVKVPRVRADGSRARDIDELAGRSLFQSGFATRATSRSQRGERSFDELERPFEAALGATAQTLVVPRPLADARRRAARRCVVEALDACRRSGEAQRRFPSAAEVTACLEVVLGVSSRWPGTLGPDDVASWARRAAKLAAQAAAGSRAPSRGAAVAPSGVEPLFSGGGPVRHVDTALVSLEDAERIWSSGVGLERLAVVALARARATAAQGDSDPDFARLCRLQGLLVSGEAPYRALLADPVLCRWSYRREHPGAAADETGASMWEAGLARSWRQLRYEEALRVVAHGCLAAGSLPDGATLGRAEVIGLLALFSRRHAARVALNFPVRASGGTRWEERARAASRWVRPLPFLAWPADVVVSVAQRHGWLLADVEEGTFTERVMAHMRAELSSGRRDACFAALSAWATGDARPFVGLLDAVDPRRERTRYTLGADASSLAAQLVVLARAAERLLGPYVAERYAMAPQYAVRESFGEALFWRFPRAIVKEAYRLGPSD